MINVIDPEKLAADIHRVYEQMAPTFDYETRPESAVPWEQVPDANRELMVAVAAWVIANYNLAAGVDLTAIPEGAVMLVARVPDRYKVEPVVQETLGHLAAEVGIPVLVLPCDGTLEGADAVAMRRAGWMRVPPPGTTGRPAMTASCGCELPADPTHVMGEQLIRCRAHDLPWVATAESRPPSSFTLREGPHFPHPDEEDPT